MTTAQQKAENDLWHALEERRDSIRASGLGFDERQHHQFRKAHHDSSKSLIDELNKAMEGYGGPTTANAIQLLAQARQQKARLDNWEHVFLRQPSSWARFVTGGARRGATRCIADARALKHLV